MGITQFQILFQTTQTQHARTCSQCHQCWSRESQDHLLTQSRRSETEEGSIIRSSENYKSRRHKQWRNVEVLH